MVSAEQKFGRDAILSVVLGLQEERLPDFEIFEDVMGGYDHDQEWTPNEHISLVLS
jgi:hypothetical protein